MRLFARRPAAAVLFLVLTLVLGWSMELSARHEHNEHQPDTCCAVCRAAGNPGPAPDAGSQPAGIPVTTAEHRPCVDIVIPGALLAGSVGAFQAVNWALLSDHVPKHQAATAFGLANVATAGAGALSGVFGVLVDALDGFLDAGTWRITFTLAALIAVSAYFPLRRIAPKDAEA